MSWWSKKVKKHMGKIALGTIGALAAPITAGASFAALPALLGWGAIGAGVGTVAGDSMDNAHAAAKLQEQQAEEAKKQAEQQKQDTLAAAEAESINADRAAIKQKKKYGRASTVLGGTTAQSGSAAKRLLGE